MGWIAKDLPTLVFMLLPGFMAAGVFYTLTAHPKSTEFERLIQSLIFTSIIKLLTIILKRFFLVVGWWHSVGRWDADAEFVWSILLAVPIGLVFVRLANKDEFHSWVRKRGLSSRTSYPSEWYAAFLREKRWVILRLTDGRRLLGWPEEWPDQADKGHFLIYEPEWLSNTNDSHPLDNDGLYRVERILIPAADVKMIEFLEESEDVSQDTEEETRVETSLIDTQTEEDKDGSENPPTGDQPAT